MIKHSTITEPAPWWQRWWWWEVYKDGEEEETGWQSIGVHVREGEKLKHVYLLGDKLDYMYLHRKWTLCDGDKNSPLDISFNILELWRFEDGRWVWITSVGERSVW